MFFINSLFSVPLFVFLIIIMDRPPAVSHRYTQQRNGFFIISHTRPYQVLCVPYRRLNKLYAVSGKHRMLMHAITSARSAFLVSGPPFDVYVRIIQQIKRQRGRANYMSYRTRWKWKLTRTSFNGQSRTIRQITLHSWNGSTGTDPIPRKFHVRKITLWSMLDDVSDYADFHACVYTYLCLPP